MPQPNTCCLLSDVDLLTLRDLGVGVGCSNDERPADDAPHHGRSVLKALQKAASACDCLGMAGLPRASAPPAFSPTAACITTHRAYHDDGQQQRKWLIDPKKWRQPCRAIVAVWPPGLQTSTRHKSRQMSSAEVCIIFADLSGSRTTWQVLRTLIRYQ